jgi:hypothetical protein
MLMTMTWMPSPVAEPMQTISSAVVVALLLVKLGYFRGVKLTWVVKSQSSDALTVMKCILQHSRIWLVMPLTDGQLESQHLPLTFQLSLEYYRHHSVIFDNQQHPHQPLRKLTGGHHLLKTKVLAVQEKTE